MSDLSAADIEVEAKRLIESLGKPKRRVRPRLARKLHEAEDQEVDIGQGAVMAWRLGAGPATLMVHGWEDDNALWSPLIDVCSDMLRASVAFDLPGHGWSSAEESSVEAAGKAVLAVAEAFGPIDSVVAHSFGCPSTIWALSHGLNVPRAVMIASPVPRTETRSHARDMGRWEQAQLHEGEEPEVIARALAMIAERPPMRSNDSGFDIEGVLPTLTTQALIIHSMDDEQCPVANSQRMAELWPGSELMLLDGLGHRLIAQEPDVVTRIFEFVDGMS